MRHVKNKMGTSVRWLFPKQSVRLAIGLLEHRGEIRRHAYHLYILFELGVPFGDQARLEFFEGYGRHRLEFEVNSAAGGNKRHQRFSGSGFSRRRDLTIHRRRRLSMSSIPRMFRCDMIGHGHRQKAQAIKR